MIIPRLEVEPKCLNVDFQQKSSEKMVRIENAMKLMIDWFIDLFEKVEHTLSSRCMKIASNHGWQLCFPL